MPIDTDILKHALIGYEQHQAEISDAIASIRSRLHRPGQIGAQPGPRPARKRRRFSAATKKRLALLAKQRWINARKTGKKTL